MEDYKIVDLYWERNENAIKETDIKYGKMLHALSFQLLSSREDAEECVNDTYLDAWNSMPEARPIYLGAFLSKITRRISIDCWRTRHREKRGGIANTMEELTDCIPDTKTLEEEYENGRLAQALNRFLHKQPTERRVIFIRRYFNSQSIGESAEDLNLTQAKVKVTLHRMREALRKELEEQNLL